MSKIIKIGCTLILSITMVLSLISCGIFDIFKGDIEVMMDDVMMGNNYTVETKSADDTYTTMKISEGNIFINIETDRGTEKIYLVAKEDMSQFYFATEWKMSEKDGFERQILDKTQYVQKYMELFDQYAHTSKVFHMRNILEMAEEIAENKYKYSSEKYDAQDSFVSRMEYTVEIRAERLELTEKFEDTTDTVSIVKVSYYDIDETEFSIPAKVTE